MKKTNLLLALVMAFLTITSCSDDDENFQIIPKVSIQSPSGSFSIPQGDTLFLIADIKSHVDYSTEWQINGETVSDSSALAFIGLQIGEYRIKLISTMEGTSFEDEKTVSVTEKIGSKPYHDGTFILNEGNMTTENGTLIFIASDGTITDSVYYKANGTFLGNSMQDLFICKEKIYFMSQAGGGDGKLIIADAGTLKKELAFNDELSALSNPTHLAVINDEHIYIRDNNGIYHFNTISQKLTAIPSTEKANKNRMAVANRNVFVGKGSELMVITGGEMSVKQSIALGAPITGVIPSSDGNVWVSCSGSPAKIVKINSGDLSVIQSNELSEGNLSSYSTPPMGAKDDTLYFSNSGAWGEEALYIYRHVFTTKQTDKLCNVKEFNPELTTTYNSLGVHPITGEVFFNTIKGYGMDYLINAISVFDFSTATPQLKNNYKNHTRFPAGIFFTDTFN